jgi:hypothetical protein
LLHQGRYVVYGDVVDGLIIQRVVVVDDLMAKPLDLVPLHLGKPVLEVSLM